MCKRLRNVGTTFIDVFEKGQNNVEIMQNNVEIIQNKVKNNKNNVEILAKGKNDVRFLESTYNQRTKRSEGVNGKQD